MSYTFPNREYIVVVADLTPPSCDFCKEPMLEGAKVCPKCRSFQGWRWWARTAGLGLPWFTAAAAASLFMFSKIEDIFIPLGKQLFVQQRYDSKTADLALDFFNYSSKPVYIVAAKLFCFKNRQERQNYFANIEERIAGTAIWPDIEKTFVFKTDGALSSAISEPSTRCKTNIIFSDFHGKTDSRQLPVAELSYSVE